MPLATRQARLTGARYIYFNNNITSGGCIVRGVGPPSIKSKAQPSIKRQSTAKHSKAQQSTAHHSTSQYITVQLLEAC